jgi:hypothetical protein
VKIATPGSTEDWMRGVNKRLRELERHGTGTSAIPTTVVVDDVEIITYAPVVPSQPITEQKVGAIAVTWNGVGAGDEQMPPNFATVEVHRSQESAEFEPDEYSLVGNLNGPGTLSFTDQPYDEIFYYRFVMRNTEGEASGPSLGAAAVASRVGGTDLTADSIDGKLITGATIQTGTTGGRAVLRPGTSISYGLGSHVIEMYTGNSSEAFPAELIAIADGSNPNDNISLLIAAPEKSGFFGNRAILQLFARDGNTNSQISALAQGMFFQGTNFVRHKTSGMEFLLDQSLESGTGVIWSSRGIDVFHDNVNLWTDVPSSTYTANGWSDYPSGAPYMPGIRWRHTHDSHVEVQVAIRTTATAAANPFVINDGHGMPMPADHFAEGHLRYLIATGYNLAPFVGFPSGGGNTRRWQLLQPAAATYTVLAGMFTYRWRYE